jgi:hypothetical protein
VAGSGLRGVRVDTDARTGLPTLGIGFRDRTRVVCVFPADTATQELLDLRTAELEDENAALRAYDTDLSLRYARFVRPENLRILEQTRQP